MCGSSGRAWVAAAFYASTRSVSGIDTLLGEIHGLLIYLKRSFVQINERGKSVLDLFDGEFMEPNRATPHSALRLAKSVLALFSAFNQTL